MKSMKHILESLFSNKVIISLAEKKSFPNELLLRIFNYLTSDAQELATLMLVNKYWLELISNANNLWKDLAKREDYVNSGNDVGKESIISVLKTFKCLQKLLLEPRFL